MIKYTLAAALTFAAVATTEAATVNWGAIQTAALLSNNPNNVTLLSQGNFVRLGFFAIDNASIQAASTVSSLASSWTSYSDAKIGDGTAVDGIFAASDIRDTAPAGNNLQNLQMYIWVIQATNNTSLATALSSATAQAVFYVDKAINPSWKFPSGFNGDSTIDIAEMTSGNALASGANIIVGNFRPNNAGAAGLLGPGSNGIQVVAPVPEPTSAFLIAVGAAGLMMRRRRQS